MICVPKSTLSNWMNELKRWCPCLRVIRFHGSKEEREALKDEYFSNEAAAHDGRRPDKAQFLENGEWIDDNSDNPRAWDVCLATYEVCNAERKILQKFAWKYLVIDEAHRLKNETSLFSQTVRTFHTQHRLLLTGTVSLFYCVCRALVSYTNNLFKSRYKTTFTSYGPFSISYYRTFSGLPINLTSGSTWKLTTRLPKSK